MTPISDDLRAQCSSSAKRYNITITETELRPKLVGNEWEYIANEGGEKVYGLSLERVKEVEVTTSILDQVVKELNLVNVIKAINDID